jgi:hypothetical protein
MRTPKENMSAAFPYAAHGSSQMSTPDSKIFIRSVSKGNLALLQRGL